MSDATIPGQLPTGAPFGAWERALAFRYLKARRKNGGIALIAWISFIAVTLAVGALIIIMSVMNGFRSEIVSRMVGFNGHIYVQGPATGAPTRDALISRIRAVPGVVQVVPVVQAQALVVGPGQVTGAIVRGMRPEDLRGTPIIARNIKGGSLDGFGQGEYGGDMVLAGSGMADRLGVKAGDSISVISPNGAATAFGSTPRRKSYTVGGVFNVGLTQYDAAYIYMPLEQAQLLFGRGDTVDLLEVNLDDADHIDALKPSIQAAAGTGAVLTDWRDENHAFFNALQVERVAMRIILMIVVAIAMLNIISGLIMLVKNKGRDIAILRTIGASPGAVMRVFVMVGAAIGLSGAACGLIFGTLFCIYIDPIQSFVEHVTGVSVFAPEAYFLPRLPARVEPGEVALVMAWSILMSLVAAIMPAWQASRLDPVEALRYE
jgi:lipoprotein-releasing system permease protein